MTDDLRELFHQRGGVYDRQNLGRIRAEEKMAQQRGTGVGAEYNPILGKPMVKDALGGVNSADWNIGGNIASGTPVQLMGRGFGIVADAKPSRPSSDALSTGNQADRTGSFGSSSGPFFPGGGTDSDGEDAYVAGPDGSCTLGNYAVGKAPPGSFKTLKECREAQDKEYNCEDGVCKVVPKGTGKYKTLGECQAALVSAGFTGGQCVGVAYLLEASYAEQGWQQIGSVTGPVSELSVKPPVPPSTAFFFYVASASYTGTLTIANPPFDGGLRARRADGGAECGDRKACPT